MIVYSTHILAAPVVLVIWALDMYIFLSSARFVLRRLSAGWARRICTGLKPFTDPVPNAIERYFLKNRSKPVPAWLPWLVAMCAILVARHLLVSMVFRTF